VRLVKFGAGSFDSAIAETGFKSYVEGKSRLQLRYVEVRLFQNNAVRESELEIKRVVPSTA
jgi:hypothetical protein